MGVSLSIVDLGKSWLPSNIVSVLMGEKEESGLLRSLIRFLLCPVLSRSKGKRYLDSSLPLPHGVAPKKVLYLYQKDMGKMRVYCRNRCSLGRIQGKLRVLEYEGA